MKLMLIPFTLESNKSICSTKKREIITKTQASNNSVPGIICASLFWNISLDDIVNYHRKMQNKETT
eukprot:GAHX01002575.1.p1 GENE.GAHX01002575.1~~GAHX01002575.1.p1  ORF type:complete len:66 (-),score=5.45 GAHX01002575.1:610-807(-)